MADRSVTYRFRGDISDLRAKMVVAGKSVSDFGDKITRADKEGAKFRRGLQQTGDFAGKLALAAGAGVAGIIAVTANFEQRMSAVQAATHETADNMELLRQAAIAAGESTAFSASEAADGIENLAKAGVATTDILKGGLSGALDLAAAGGIGVGEAAEVAATALTQFNLAGEDVPHVADLLAAAAGKAQGEVGDMAYALKQSGLVAAQMGLTIEETTGSLSAFAAAGLLGSDAGTSLRTMLLRLANPAEKAKDTMEAYGISAYDANGQLVSMSELAGQLEKGLGTLTQAERDKALATIFGSDAIRAANVLYTQGAQGIADWTNRVNDAGYAAETAATRMDNLRGDVEEFTGALETAFISAGSGSQEGLRGFVQGATEGVRAFNALDPAIQGAATQALALTAITGGGLWFGSKVIQGIADTRAALDDLGPTAQRAGRMMRTGLAIGGTLTATYMGLDLLLTKLQDVAGLDVSESNLARGVEALAQGAITGNLDEIANNLGNMNSGLNKVTNTLFGWAPGSDAIEVAEKNIAALDEQLASMVEGGNADQAAAALRTLQTEADRVSDVTGREIGDVAQYFEQYNLALDNANGRTSVGGQIMRPFADIVGAVGSAATGATEGVDALAGAMEDATAEAYTLENVMDLLFARLDAGAAEDAWTEGIQGLAEALKSGDGALSKFTETGRKNRDEIRQQIELLRARAETEYESTGNAKLLERRLLEGREAIIKQAVAAGIGREALEKYLKALGLTPREIRTNIRLLGADKAADDVDNVRFKVKLLREEIMRMNRTQANVRIRGTAIDQGYAEGGRISGPGTGTSDSIPAWVSDGEWVIKAAAVRKYGDRMLHDINSMRFAEGGTYRAQRASSYTTNNYGAGIDYDRLARSMLMARPLYETANFYGNDDFQRQQAVHRRNRAGGGR